MFKSLLITLITPTAAFAFPTGSWTCRTSTAQANTWTFQVSSALIGTNQLPYFKINHATGNGGKETIEGLGVLRVTEDGDVILSMTQGRAGIPFTDIRFAKNGSVTANGDLLVCQ